jgi:hypothetical protein
MLNDQSTRACNKSTILLVLNLNRKGKEKGMPVLITRRMLNYSGGKKLKKIRKEGIET